MFLTSEIRRFVQLAEEALKLKEADPTHAITGLMRVKELLLDSLDLWIDQFIDKSSQVSHSDQESLYYGWYSEAVYTVMHQNRRYGLLWAREKGRWYQPIYDDDRSEILVSDIRYYIDNYYSIFEKEAKRAECERLRMDEVKFFCMPSTLDEELPCEMDLTKFGLDYSPDIICTADLLARDLQMAIYNEEVRLADEAYVRGFIDAEQRRQLLDDCMPFTKNDGADNKEVSHFAIGNSDKEVLEVLKGLKSAEWRNRRKKVVGFVEDDVTAEEWLSALKGPTKDRPAAERKIPFKAVFICKAFVAQYLEGDYELAERVFCGPGGMELKKLRYINMGRNEDICDEKTGQMAKIIRKAMVITDESQG